MRIDIRLVSKESYIYALLYFTGSKKNNTLMRNKAIQAGLKLNEYSLTDKNSKNIQLNSEQEIYEYLNMTYILPENR
jgi:DNA polymerase (family 10)